ncbi:MAG: hypothetical protein WBL68_15425 [Nitrososphaeraceae archaeon]|jgi:hypothetical protein
MTNAKRSILYFGAAVCTGIAGILHLILVSSSINSHLEYATFFLISGVAQIFWVVPMVKKWGRTWYVIGIAGTLVMVGLTGYVIVNIVENPQSAPPGVSEMAVAIEVLQVSYVIMTGIIIAKRG